MIANDTDRFSKSLIIALLIVAFILVISACAFGFLGINLIRKSKPTVVHISADEDFPSRLSPIKED
ncbi:hypothetical protein [Pedobacter sp.]